MRETRRTEQDILKSFSSHRGVELVQAMATEIGALYQLIDELQVALEQVQAQQDLKAHMFTFGHDAGRLEGLPTELQILPQYLLEGQAGFYSLEHTADGVPFRWTGPERDFSFSVCVDRAEPVNVRLEALAIIDRQRQGNVCLHVDGAAVPFPLEWDGTRYMGEAVLPAAPLRAITKLTFTLPITLTVPDSTTDLRELGLGFSRLTIRPLAIPARPEHSSDPAEAAVEEPAAAETPADILAVVDASAPEYGLSFCAQAFSFSAEQIADGYPGLLELETEQGGLPFRWSDGQGTFSFSLPIDRGGFIAATLKLADAVDLRRQSPMTIVVDGETHRVPISETGAGLLEARLILPPVVGRKAVSLTFEVSPLARKGKGRRRYGVAFRELILQPALKALPAANVLAAPLKPKRSSKTGRRSAPRPVRESVTVTGT